MHHLKEKGCLAEGSPIPKIIPRQELPEFSELSRELQVNRLTRRCAISAAMAAIVAPMIWEANR